MFATGRRERTLVEPGMGDGRAAGKMAVDHVMDVSETRFADDVMRGDAVDARVETLEDVAGVDQRFKGERFLAVPEPDDADLADAADARTGGFDIDDDEIGCLRAFPVGH